MTAFLRSDGYLSRCLSRSLDSPVGSDAINEAAEAKWPHLLSGGLRISTWKHVFGYFCSPGPGLARWIVRSIISFNYSQIVLTDTPAFSSLTWSFVTINLNRSLLRLRRADVKHYLLAENSSVHRVASPFALYRTSTGPDFDQDVLDEFDDIKAEAADELKLRSFEIPSRKRREISIRLGNTGK